MKSPMELLCFNPNLAPESPEGKLPLGIEFKQHGANLISRTSWVHESTECVVYGKSGRETNHDDNDVGQLLIDGFGERLIIDPGKPDPIYPRDYFGKTQSNYYTRSSRGHNVLVIGNEEMVSEPNNLARGKTVRSWFDDSVGSSWEIDLTPVYGNATKVTRKVAHLFPGIVLVHDYSELPKADSIVLRWHTINPSHWTALGAFRATTKSAAVVAKVISLDKNELNFSAHHQEFKPPYNLSRQGDPLEQNYEPFVKISTYGRTCSILSLFAISKNIDEFPSWKQTESGWSILNNGVEYVVKIHSSSFELYSKNNSRRILLE